MFWRRLWNATTDPRAEQMRRAHSRWLTRALRAHKPPPRIPTRRVSDGGFDHLRASAQGMAIAAAWWDETLESVRPNP